MPVPMVILTGFRVCVLMRVEPEPSEVSADMSAVLQKQKKGNLSAARRRMTLAWGLALLLAAAWPLRAQQGVLHEGRPALRFITSKGAMAYVYQVDFNGEPALRFMVMHVHRGDCAGYLYVTRTRIAYDPVFSPDYRQDGFNLPRGQYREAKVEKKGNIKIQTAYRKFNLYALYERGTRRYLGYGKSSRALTTLLGTAFTNFENAMAGFNRETAGLQVPAAPVAAAPPQSAAQPGGGPKVRIMDPAITDPSQPVEVSLASVALRGAALDPKGVLSVVVNGREAELRSAGDIRAVEFSLKDLTVKEGLNRVEVVATNVDNQTTKLEVLLWGNSAAAPAAPPNPAPASPAAATVPPTTTPTTPVEVAPEEPPVPIESTEDVPLRKDEILQMLQSGLPSEQVADLVKESGIDFDPTEDYFRSLREAGGDDELIQALRKAKRVKP